MKRVLVDSENKVVYEGEDAKSKLKEGLKYEVHFDLKFKGIDDWNRPVFKDVDAKLYFGSTNKLYSDAEFQKRGLQFFKENPGQLEYFGDHFNCEPNGGTQDFFKFNILD